MGDYERCFMGSVKKTRLVCISHKEDLDGLGSAALVRQATGAEPILVDYVGQMSKLKEISEDLSLKVLHICDLGLSKKNEAEFVDVMATLRHRHVRVTYVDHHDIRPDIVTKLVDMGVNVIHSTDECTAVQVYHKYEKKLPEGASFIATCAAITDYMDSKPLAAKLLQKYDRQFALISATVLTYNIVGHQKDTDYLLYLVDQLTELKFPHEIPNAYENAQLQVGYLADTMSRVRQGYKKMRNLAHMEMTDTGASGAVNFVLGFSGKPVGVAYKERTEQGAYAISIRGAPDLNVHLGRIVSSLAADFDGTGGGHAVACGALIPKKQMKAFLRTLNERLGKSL